LVGEYNFANIMAAFAVGREMNIPVEQIKKAIEMYSPDNSRSQLIQRGTTTIILDAYNANPTSMSAAISNFAQADYSNKIIMLGAMKELGDESEAEHEKIISLLEQTNWNKVVLVGGDFKKVHHSYLYFDTSAEAQGWFQSQQIEHTAFLIKGSRAFQMEKVIST
jgi:UDP-N-acetylmuramoyl-tripeptide--D-alanyl-D-alanine ligase